MKQILAFLLAAAMLLILVSCSPGNTEDSTDDVSDQTNENETTTEKEDASLPEDETSQSGEDTSSESGEDSTTEVSAANLAAKPSVEEAISLYMAAGRKTKAVESYTATRTQTVSLGVKTGKTLLGIEVDDLINQLYDNTINTAQYQRNGDTYSLSLSHSIDANKYYEYASGGRTEFKNEDGYWIMDKSGSGTSGEVTAMLKTADLLKMAYPSDENSFMPLQGKQEIASFTSADVETYDYSYDSATGARTLKFGLHGDAADKAMECPDLAAMKSDPYKIKFGVTITIQFLEISMIYENVWVEMKLDADGYMTSLHTHYDIVESQSSCRMQATVVGEMDSPTISGFTDTGYVFSNINSAERPARPF